MRRWTNMTLRRRAGEQTGTGSQPFRGSGLATEAQGGDESSQRSTHPPDQPRGTQPVCAGFQHQFRATITPRRQGLGPLHI